MRRKSEGADFQMTDIHSRLKNEPIYFTHPNPDAISRPLVIDGCNIGRSASGHTRSHVDCAGLVAVVRWLLIRGFDVIVFLPVVYNNINNFNSKNAELLHKMEQLGIVTFTPARSGCGSRRAFINYDDLYVVSYATKYGGTILSGDKFKDILNQGCYSDYHQVIRQRTIDIKFYPMSMDYVNYNNDMFYRYALDLAIYDNTTTKMDNIRRRLFAVPTDADYRTVAARRSQISSEKRAYLKTALEEMLHSKSLSDGRDFRCMDRLPIIENVMTFKGINIDDVFDKEFCEEFYARYPKIEYADGVENVFVTDPIIDDIQQPTMPIHEPPNQSKLPTDLSSKSLLEWFNKVENLI